MIAIKNGEYKENTIKLNNGKIKRIDKEIENPEKDIYKILKKSNYAEIKVVTENGKIVNIQQIIKEKK